MSKKTLIETNPYLKSPDEYLKALVTNVASSTAIETGESTETIARSLTKSKTHLSLCRAAKIKKSSE